MINKLQLFREAKLAILGEENGSVGYKIAKARLETDIETAELVRAGLMVTPPDSSTILRGVFEFAKDSGFDGFSREIRDYLGACAIKFGDRYEASLKQPAFIAA